MAGARSPKSRVDKTKKRKRDTNEVNGQSKRPRPQETNGEFVTGEQELAEAAGQKLVAKMDTADAGWRISKPMGGRMLDIDPILTKDEQYVLMVVVGNKALLANFVQIFDLDVQYVASSIFGRGLAPCPAHSS
jgi:NET1-associated nuclear protein 1 (U3 small nucleolar RNA-associated protein 17)